jgi:hypothetical protein
MVLLLAPRVVRAATALMVPSGDRGVKADGSLYRSRDRGNLLGRESFMPEEPKRTLFAQAAVNLATYFEMMFEDTRVGGVCPRRPILKVPEGESTGGGRQAVQHIILKPEKPGFPTITVGWINMSNHTAQLKTYGCLEALQAQRYGGGPGVDRMSYQDFLDQVQRLCGQQSVTLTWQVEPPKGPAPVKEIRRVGRSHTFLMVFLVILLAAGLGVAAVFAYLRFFE